MLYSEAFRRLGGVTQVAQGTPSMSLHNRLTHSLKVEQVGISLYSKFAHQANDLNDVADSDAIAAACLSHDIGHPPFGHAGEEELNEILICDGHRENPRPIAVRKSDPCGECKLEDGFEGNAQSFRVLAVLAVHRESASTPLGLDLTRATLAAASKYPWTKGTPGRKRNKWGAYDCDFEILQWVLRAEEAAPNLDAQVMDWADDISYAVHDIEDFFRNGVIPLDDYRPRTQALETFLEYAKYNLREGLDDSARAAFEGALQFFPKSRFSGRSEDLAVLDRMRSIILGKFIDSTTLDTNSSQLLRDETQNVVNAIMKQLIWFHVIDEPRLANIQTGQRRVLNEIFTSLYSTARDTYHSGRDAEPTERELRRLPQALRRAIEVGMQQASPLYTHRQKICRGVVDYIAGLSDLEAYQLHAVLRGREYAGHL